MHIPYKRLIFGVVSLLFLIVQVAPSFAREGDGQWLPKQTVAKPFNTWITKIASGRPMLRFYVNQTHYYDHVEAIISLKNFQNGVYIDAGDLIFFSDNSGELPIDRNEAGTTVTLFYYIHDYPAILQNLQTHRSGMVEWVYLEQTISGDQIAGYVVGQIRFDAIK